MRRLGKVVIATCPTFCGLNLMGTLRFAHPTFFALRFTVDFKAPSSGFFCGRNKPLITSL